MADDMRIDELTDEQLEAELKKSELETPEQGESSSTEPEGPKKADEEAKDRPANVEPDEHERERRGLINELRTLRDERKELRSRLDQLQKELETVKAGNGKPGEQEETGDEDEDEDGIVTKADLKRLIKEQQEALKREREQQEAEKSRAAMMELLAKQEQEAIKRHSVETEGEGLDFNSVIAGAEEFLTEGDKQAIINADDKAEELYQICLIRNRKLRQRLLSRATQTPTPKTGDKKNTQKSAQFTITDPDINKIRNLSDEELERLLEEERKRELEVT